MKTYYQYFVSFWVSFSVLLVVLSIVLWLAIVSMCRHRQLRIGYEAVHFAIVQYLERLFQKTVHLRLEACLFQKDTRDHIHKEGFERRLSESKALWVQQNAPRLTKQLLVFSRGSQVLQQLLAFKHGAQLPLLPDVLLLPAKEPFYFFLFHLSDHVLFAGTVSPSSPKTNDACKTELLSLMQTHSGFSEAEEKSKKRRLPPTPVDAWIQYDQEE